LRSGAAVRSIYGRPLSGRLRHGRITAQLVRAGNGYHIWSLTYERKLDDIFKIQEEIAASIVQALKASLLADPMPIQLYPGPIPNLASARGTNDGRM
jgi:hypothetical protein